MPSETITIPLKEYEHLVNSRVVLFGENSGDLTDEELEAKAVEAALKAADIPPEWSQPIQQACWAYMQVYVDYVPF